MSNNKRKKGTGPREKTEKKSSIVGKIIALLACVPFWLIGFAFIKIGIEQISDLKDYTAKTKGVISDVTVQKKEKSAGFGYIRNYKASYSYEYNGITYTDTIESTNKLKKGKVLRIRCNPDRPKENYVKWYDTSGRVFLLVFGVVWDAFFLFIVYSILISFKSKISKKKSADPTDPDQYQQL